MADYVAAASPAAPEVTPAEKSDGKKSGNVSLVEMAQRLKKAPVAAPSERLTGDTTAPAPAGTPTPVAEATDASRTSPAVPAVVTPAAPTEPAAVTPVVTEEETPPDLSQLSNLDPHTKQVVENLLKQQKERIQGLIDKRINKEVLKTKTLQDELAALRGTAPLQQTQVPMNGLFPLPAVAAPMPAPVLAQTDFPLAEIHDMNALVAKQREAQNYRQLADDALAIGADDDGKFSINGENFSKEQVVNIRRSANEILNVQVPQRAQFLQFRQQAVKTAYEEFPWLKDQASSEYQQATSMLTNAPWLKNMPNAELFLGIHIEGLKAIEARKKAAGQPAPVVTKPRPPGDQTALGGGGGAPSRATPGARAQDNLSVEIGKLSAKRTVSIRDAASFLARKEQLSQSR